MVVIGFFLLSAKVSESSRLQLKLQCSRQMSLFKQVVKLRCSEERTSVSDHQTDTSSNKVNEITNSIQLDVCHNEIKTLVNERAWRDFMKIFHLYLFQISSRPRN